MKSKLITELKELEGVKDIAALRGYNGSVVVFFEQIALEETTAKLLSISNNSEYTITRYVSVDENGDPVLSSDRKMMLFQHDPDNEMDDWKTRAFSN